MSNVNLTVIYFTGDVANKAFISKKKIIKNLLHQLYYKVYMITYNHMKASYNYTYNYLNNQSVKRICIHIHCKDIKNTHKNTIFAASKKFFYNVFKILTISATVSSSVV